MLLTEKDAKTKWCPFSRTAIGEDFDDGRGLQLVSSNRAMDYAAPHSCRCMASDCMAWRWADTFNANAQTAFEATCPTGASMGCEVTGPQPVGYCGLSGKPEEAESC